MAINPYFDWKTPVWFYFDNFADHTIINGAVFKVFSIVAVDYDFLTNMKIHQITLAFLLRDKSTSSHSSSSSRPAKVQRA